MNFWDKVAGVYDAAQSVNGKVISEMTDMVTRLIPDGAKVLDCAAGTGMLTIAAAKKAESVLCTDMSEKMLAKAKRNVYRQGLDNVTFDKHNIFSLPEEDETFDAVIAGNVLHLILNPEKAVRELYRVTKKGGKLLLPTFVLGKFGSQKHELIKNAGIKLYKLLGFNPSCDYTPSSYKEMLKGCGIGEVKTKLIRGMLPCCFAVIYKV